IILVIGKKDKLKITSKFLDWIKETYQVDEIILVEKTDKPRPIVEALINPYKLVSLNEIFLATGDVQFRAVLSEENRDSLLFTKEELEQLIYELTGKITRVEFQ
ncbi:MAG: hypothetical protein ACFFFT_02060, partial [Candidatus Thorarchaeota archaeon]